MEWKEVRLGDVCSKIGSGATPSGGKEAYKGGDYHLIRSQNVLDFAFSKDGLASINDEQANKLKNVEIIQGDVLLNITGDSVARCCIVPSEILPARVNQHVAIIRPRKEELDKHYLLYYLQHYKRQLLQIASAGATRNAITKAMIENLILPCPKSLDDQRRIASILSSLDRKIELNNKINDDLEEMAQAIFKNWFVDFEPFKDGKFVDSELGMIPEGWKVVTLDDLTSKFGTGLNPRKNFVLGHGNNYYVTIKNMGNNRIYLNDRCDKVDDEALAKINKRSKLQKGDLLFSGIGTIGRVAMIVDDPINWNTSESVFNMHPIDTVSSEFIYLLLLSDKFQQYVQQNAQGGVQQGIRMASLKAFQFAIPDDLNLFDNLVKPIISKVKSNDKENDALSLLRDTLLPRLMSGELEVPE